MNPQRVIDESIPMLDDVLGSIGIHRPGTKLDMLKIRRQFSDWISQQQISDGAAAFMTSIIGAFICEYFIKQQGALRFIQDGRIFLKVPLQEGILREFDPYAAAHGITTKKLSLDEFLTNVSDR